MATKDETTPLLHQSASVTIHSRDGQTKQYSSTTEESQEDRGRSHNVHLGRSNSLENTPKITLSWKDISVSIITPKKKRSCCGGEVDETSVKTVLKSVSGVVQPCSLLAIMGASGAGKSTLLNVLTCRNTKPYQISGEIRFNGHEIGSGIKNVSAYVQQDDLFISTLTVREQLQFRALLRMDKQLNKQSRLKRVEEVILEMGLTSCADNRIGTAGGDQKGISGGERKRLSFASEALTNPPIFFCDEPTSGLDTFMAQNIVHTLQNMASRGRTILCTIHQPSSELFAMFNQILLLAEGRTAFVGSPEAAISFFDKLSYTCPTNFNPADHYILTLAIVPGKEEECRKRTHMICDAFSDSQEMAEMYTEIAKLEDSAKTNTRNESLLIEASRGESRYSSGWLTQFRYLFWRAWISQFRDRILFRVRIMQVLFVGIILGLVYLRLTLDQKGVMNINGAIFLLITNTTFSNLFAVVNSFPLEMAIFMREYGSGLYRVDTYYLTKTISEMPIFFLISIIFTTVTYWMIGLYASWDAFLIAAGILLLTANVAVSLGYLLSTICGSVTVTLAVGPPVLIPFMLFGGLFLNNGDIPVYFVWLEYISWFKYANEILMVNQWTHVDHIPCGNQTLSINSTHQCQYRTGQDVLDYTSFKESNMLLDIFLMACILVGFRVLSFLALLIRARLSKE